jgi:hypothetical protein
MSKIPCILLLIASLFGQDGDGDFSLGEISFMIKDIHNWWCSTGPWSAIRIEQRQRCPGHRPVEIQLF